MPVHVVPQHEAAPGLRDPGHPRGLAGFRAFGLLGCAQRDALHLSLGVRCESNSRCRTPGPARWDPKLRRSEGFGCYPGPEGC